MCPGPIIYLKAMDQGRPLKRPTLKKISGTKMVPQGHRLIVHKTVPFGAPFWCHFPKGALLSAGTTSFWCLRGTKIVPFLSKKAPFFKMVPQGHCFSTLFSLSVGRTMTFADHSEMNHVTVFPSEKVSCCRVANKFIKNGF